MIHARDGMTGGVSGSVLRAHLQLLLRAQLVAARLAVLLAAADGPRVQTAVAGAADQLVLVELLGKLHQAGLDHAAAQAQHQMQRRLCRKAAARERDRERVVRVSRCGKRHVKKFARRCTAVEAAGVKAVGIWVGSIVHI